jgi:hypothetical protein
MCSGHTLIDAVTFVGYAALVGKVDAHVPLQTAPTSLQAGGQEFESPSSTRRNAFRQDHCPAACSCRL